MEKLYERINFENVPSTKTPLNEENLNKMDYAIYEEDNRIIQLNGGLNNIVVNNGAMSPVMIDLPGHNVVNGIFSASGVFQSDINRIITKDFIDIHDFFDININLPDGYRYNIAFYNKPDEASFVGLLSNSWIDQSMDILRKANYMRIQAYNTNSAPTKPSEFANFTVTGRNNAVYRSIIESKKAKGNYSGNVHLDFYNDFTQGYLSNGNLVVSNSFISTENYIPTNGLRSINIDLLDGYRCWIIMYDSNKAFLCASPPMYGAGIFNVDVTGCSYIKIQVARTSGYIFTGNGIDAITVRGTTLDRALKNTDIGVQNIFVNGAIVNGEISNALSRISTKPYIDISDFGIVGITVKNGYYFAVAFYSDASASDLMYATPWMYSNDAEVIFDTTTYSYMRISVRSSDNVNLSPDLGTVVTKVRGVKREYCYQYGLSEKINTVRTYEGERIALNPTLNYYNVLARGSIPTTYPYAENWMQQGAGIYNGTMFMFRHHGACTVLDVDTLSVINEYVITDITDDKPHCNSCTFSKVFPSGNSDFPYCYTGRCSYAADVPDITSAEQNACYVLDINESRATLAQTIIYENNKMDYTYSAWDWFVDADRSRLVCIGYGANNGVSNRPYIIKEFNLPNVSDGETITLTDNDVIEQWYIEETEGGHLFEAFQGCTAYGEYYIIPASEPECLGIFNKYTKRLVAYFDLKEEEVDEVQSAAVWNGALYLISEEGRIDKIIFN